MGHRVLNDPNLVLIVLGDVLYVCQRQRGQP